MTDSPHSLIGRLQQFVAGGDIAFILTSPRHLTVLSHHVYRKRAFIGEELFALKGVRATRTTPYLFIFTSSALAAGEVIEMKLDEACACLQGFKAFADELFAKVEDALVADIRAGVAEPDVAPAPHPNPLYGSW